LAETAIRSYDPCISCSAHFLTLSVEQRQECRTVYPVPSD
jgi:coenzyme F420-reducing hydrogenase alpha subunit